MDETQFGRYRLLELLGEGGMGQVFRAYDTATDRQVALKVLTPQLAQDPTFEQRFRREAQVAARLNDPHVVPIHNYGEIDGRLYVDMQLIVGRDVGSLLEECGAMNPARAVGIIEQVAEALEAAHAIGLVHRDIKPSNILLAKRDFVYLIDFGIAQDADATRLTRTGAAIGTFAYMAPERLDSGQAGPSSDIYSLSCVLYECLTGQLPFPAVTMQQQIAAHLSKPPPRPSAVVASVSPAFDEVIARGMAKNTDERYPTVIALADAARGALESQSRAMSTHQAATRWATTQQAAPRPGPPGPWPPVPTPPYAPAGHPGALGADTARLTEIPRDQRARRPANFVLPGILLIIFAVLSAIFAVWLDIDSYSSSYYQRGIIIASLYLPLWLVLSAAFGVVAVRCGRSERALAITAWLTCAAALVAALAMGLLIIFLRSTVGLLPELTFLALIAFGAAAHRPFGKWWSIPATAAGLLGALGYTYSPVYAGFSHFILTPFSLIVFVIMLTPLLILGIVMSRARRHSTEQSTAS